MPASIARRGTVLLAGVGALLLLALATAPWAGASTIYACVAKKGGVVHIISKPVRCKKGEAKRSWNTKGPAGTAGVRSVNGASGVTGASGPAGTIGESGAAGPTGPRGTVGAAGSPGASGETGANGTKGNTGPAGSTGPSGEIGVTGAKGTNGVTGAAGSTGATGEAGATGTSGAVGGRSVAQPASESVAFTSGTEGSPTTIVSRTLPAGNYIVNAKVELEPSDTKLGGQTSVACNLADTPSEGGAPASDTAGWTTLINVPFTSFFFARNTLPLTLAVSSATHSSTISVVCYVLVKEASGGTFGADANNAAITAVQTTLNS